MYVSNYIPGNSVRKRIWKKYLTCKLLVSVIVWEGEGAWCAGHSESCTLLSVNFEKVGQVSDLLWCFKMSPFHHSVLLTVLNFMLQFSSIFANDEALFGCILFKYAPWALQIVLARLHFHSPIPSPTPPSLLQFQLLMRLVNSEYKHFRITNYSSVL